MLTLCLVIHAVQRDYLFNQKQADAIFAVERAKLDKKELADRLAGKAKERAATSATPDATAASSASASQQVSRAPSPTRTRPENGTNGDPEDSLFGDMLDEPQSTPAAVADDTPEKDSKGNIIKIRDMSLPKSYTGKTPKSLLEDALRRVDKSAKATYRLLSHTRAARAVVSVRWEGGRMQQFGMEDEACETQEQAYHYAATLALFAISSDGNLHRLLPGPYRDLWDELEARKRTTLADLYAKEILACKEIASFRAAQSVQEVGTVGGFRGVLRLTCYVHRITFDPTTARKRLLKHLLQSAIASLLEKLTKMFYERSMKLEHLRHRIKQCWYAFYPHALTGSCLTCRFE